MSPVDDEILERKVRDLLAARTTEVGAEPGLLDDVHRTAGAIRARRRAATGVTALGLVAAVAGVTTLAVPHDSKVSPAHRQHVDHAYYDWPTRGSLAHDHDAIASALEATKEIGSEPPVVSRRVLWLGRVTGGYAGLVRTVTRSHGRDIAYTTAVYGHRTSAGGWALDHAPNQVLELDPAEALACLFEPSSSSSDSFRATTLLVLLPPASTDTVEYAVAAQVDADGKVQRVWHRAPVSDGVARVDGVPVHDIADTAVRVHLPNGGIREAMPGIDSVMLDLNTQRWNGHQVVQSAAHVPLDAWARRHGVSLEDITTRGLWARYFHGGRPATLSVLSVGRLTWAVFSVGRTPRIVADIPWPPNQATYWDDSEYAGPPEASAYLPTSSGHCTLAVVVPRGTMSVTLDGTPVHLHRWTALREGSQCSGGELVVRGHGGQITYQGPVDSDRS